MSPRIKYHSVDQRPHNLVTHNEGGHKHARKHSSLFDALEGHEHMDIKDVQNAKKNKKSWKKKQRKIDRKIAWSEKMKKGFYHDKKSPLAKKSKFAKRNVFNKKFIKNKPMKNHRKLRRSARIQSPNSGGQNH